MPYVAQRKFTMFGQQFAWPGNGYDLPHIVPAEIVERLPHRTLNNMLSRGSIKQVEAVSVGNTTTLTEPDKQTVLETDPRVVVEGSGWYLVDGKRVHGRKGVNKALAETGG